jgi:hypothetical protein
MLWCVTICYVMLCSVLLPCCVCCLLKSKCKAYTILTGPWYPMELVISSGGDFFSAPDGTLRAVVCHMHPPLRPHARGNGKSQRVSSHLKLHPTAYHCLHDPTALCGEGASRHNSGSRYLSTPMCLLGVWRLAVCDLVMLVCPSRAASLV